MRGMLGVRARRPGGRGPLPAAGNGHLFAGTSGLLRLWLAMTMTGRGWETSGCALKGPWVARGASRSEAVRIDPAITEPKSGLRHDGILDCPQDDESGLGLAQSGLQVVKLLVRTGHIPERVALTA
jgi:hypothetical protein